MASFGFKTERLTAQSNWDRWLQVALAPLWHARMQGLWWFILSLVFAILLFSASLMAPNSSNLQFGVNMVFLSIAAGIKISWFRRMWRIGGPFSMHGYGMSLDTLIISTNVAGWLIMLLLLVFPGLVAAFQGLGHPLRIWWEAPIWGFVLMLSASAIAHWDCVLRKLLPAHIAAPGIWVLALLLFGVSGIALPMTTMPILPLTVPGGAAIANMPTPFIPLASALAYWGIGYVALRLSFRTNPLWIKR